MGRPEKAAKVGVIVTQDVAGEAKEKGVGACGECILLEEGPAPLPGRHWCCLAFQAGRGERH